MKRPLLQTENRVRRTYRGGKSLDSFLGKGESIESFYPEDWISSFIEAKNKDYIKGEGLSKVIIDGKEVSITDAVSKEDLGCGREECGVLVKLLDAGERLGIQVHPTPEFSMKHFGCAHGKTECWHILSADDDASIYIGFKEGITREEWKRLFDAQDIEGMLAWLHCMRVSKGDTVLVRAGTPHAIGKGCFLLEIQEPTDYTMRVEKITVAGEHLTPMQIHYGIGEDALLDCFIYEGLSESEAREKYFLFAKMVGGEYPDTMMVTYEDTPCFALGRICAGDSITPSSFVTLVVTKAGRIRFGNEMMTLTVGSKVFVPYGCGKCYCEDAEAIVCYPPSI